MDMTNTTAAGPSFGLFDVLFGNVPKENPETEGNEFGSVLKLIKSLEADSQQSIAKQVVDPDWTAKEIQPLTMADAHGVMSGENNLIGKQDLIDAQLLAMQKEKEISAKLSADISAEKMLEIKEKIKEKMPDISDAELNRLLNQDSAKMAQALAMLKANAESLKPEQTQKADMPKHKDAKLSALNLKNAKANELQELKPVDANEAKALLAKSNAEVKNPNAKGAEVLNRKSEVIANSNSSNIAGQVNLPTTQEKWTSTDDFLQMQNAAKDNKSVAAGNLNSAQTALPIGAANKQGSSSGSREEGAEKQNLGKNLKLDGAKNALHLGQHFDANLKHSMGIASKDLFLSNANPNELRAGLTTEVVQQVRIQAGSGGGEMKLVLHPEGLGEIRLKVGEKNGSVDVQLVASNDEVANMLKQSSSELSEALSDQKLNLAKFDVSVAHDKSVVASSDSKGSGFEQSFQNSNSFAQNWNGDSTSARQDSRQERGSQPAYFDEGLQSVGRGGVKQNIAARSAPSRGSNLIDVVA